MRIAGTRLLVSAFSVGALTIVVHAVALLKDLVLANRFGTGDGLDAFLIAFLLPSVAGAFISGSFGSAFMPTFVHVRERKGDEAARRFYTSAYLLLALVLAGAAFLCILLLELALPWVASGFPAAKRDLTLALAWIVAPTLFTSGVAAVWTILLNARHRFAAGAIAPVVLPAALIMFVVAQPGADPHALAWGALAGSVLHMAFMGWMAHRDGLELVPALARPIA
jgi:putative peptidoglycan lipid II flippase